MVLRANTYLLTDAEADAIILSFERMVRTSPRKSNKSKLHDKYKLKRKREQIRDKSH